MKSKIRTVDALLAEERSYPSNLRSKEVRGIKIGVLGFENVQGRDVLRRPISKIINPSTKLNDN